MKYQVPEPLDSPVLLTVWDATQGLPLAAAIDEVILNVLPPETGGMIGVDSNGKVHASYNTAGMFTGEMSSSALVEGKGGESEAMGRGMEGSEVR